MKKGMMMKSANYGKKYGAKKMEKMSKYDHKMK